MYPLKVMDMNIAIVVSDFHSAITESLLIGAKEAYKSDGGKEANLNIYHVPGAYEIPATVKQILINTKCLDAIVTLGVVIRGETAHFDYVASECARGIGNLSIKYDIPIMFGVLTTENTKQALERAGEKNNKGWDVMQAAIKMINVYKEIKSQAH